MPKKFIVENLRHIVITKLKFVVLYFVYDDLYKKFVNSEYRSIKLSYALFLACIMEKYHLRNYLRIPITSPFIVYI